MKKAILIALLAVLVIQVVPYGRAHVNPPVREEPRWDQPVTRYIARRACFDCHSNETTWPWYSFVAPASWLVQRDVNEGRAVLNFSEWNRPQEEAKESAEVVESGEMPPSTYVMAHPEARMSRSELQMLIQGLRESLHPRASLRRGNDYE